MCLALPAACIADVLTAPYPATSAAVVCAADDSLRITRGDGGSVFVLLREQGNSYNYSGSSAFSGSAAAASDLEALEDLDPPAATSAAPADVAPADVDPALAAAAAGSAPGKVVIVEASAVQEGNGDNGTNGSASA